MLVVVAATTVSAPGPALTRTRLRVAAAKRVNGWVLTSGPTARLVVVAANRMNAVVGVPTVRLVVVAARRINGVVGVPLLVDRVSAATSDRAVAPVILPLLVVAAASRVSAVPVVA